MMRSRENLRVGRGVLGYAQNPQGAEGGLGRRDGVLMACDVAQVPRSDMGEVRLHGCVVRARRASAMMDDGRYSIY